MLYLLIDDHSKIREEAQSDHSPVGLLLSLRTLYGVNARSEGCGRYHVGSSSYCWRQRPLGGLRLYQL